MNGNPAWVVTPPEPGALIESLRAFGYSPHAAVADLIDNSIAAGARTIRIDGHWNGERSWLRVSDDGAGMTEHVLNEAMRLGGKGPLVLRDERDLGRFGLGLKTASFSQCRHLTVRSVPEGGPSNIRRWDLDYVGATGEWRLLTDGLTEQKSLLENPINPAIGAGTVVLLQQMDRVVKGAGVNDVPARKLFLAMLREIENHLSLTFHRFMIGRGKIRLLLNGNPIVPWDPFLADEDATQHLPEEVLFLNGEEITVQPYVLPHISRFESRKDHDQAGGTGGWNAHQGFYVYRNRRLLAAGDWLGLPFKKEEHYKLARIQIDIPNTIDQEWDTDVRKSRARPPGILRDDLIRIAKTTRNRAVEVYRHRGKSLKKLREGVQIDLWDRKTRGGKVHYALNRDHPAILQLIVSAAEHRSEIETVLRLVEETVPTAMITLDHSEREADLARPFEGVDAAVLLEAGRPMFRMFLRQGLSVEDARAKLSLVEPFNLHSELVQVLAEEVQD